MGLFNPGSSTSLADVLGGQAQTATNTINEGYAKKKRQAISQRAATGGLESGNFNYTLGDINASQLGEVGAVQSNLADALSSIPTNDYASSNEYARNLQLAELIGKLNKPNQLQNIIGGATTGASAGSALGPYGALAGGFGGGLAGFASGD